MADFVYSVLSVGSTSSPGVIRAAVKDIQLHPVKKLLFLKFSEQQIRDEVATRLQAGLVWPWTSPLRGSGCWELVLRQMRWV